MSREEVFASLKALGMGVVVLFKALGFFIGTLGKFVGHWFKRKKYQINKYLIKKESLDETVEAEVVGVKSDKAGFIKEVVLDILVISFIITIIVKIIGG